MLDLETLKWSFGPRLPFPLHGASSLQYGEDTFAIVGGVTVATIPEVAEEATDAVLIIRPEVERVFTVGENL